MDLRITSDCGCLEKYFEKVLSHLGEIMFPVGLGGSNKREAFGAVNYAVCEAMSLGAKIGKMFLEMACQVLLRRVAVNR